MQEFENPIRGRAVRGTAISLCLFLTLAEAQGAVASPQTPQKPVSQIMNEMDHAYRRGSSGDTDCQTLKRDIIPVLTQYLNNNRPDGMGRTIGESAKIALNGIGIRRRWCGLRIGTNPVTLHEGLSAEMEGSNFAAMLKEFSNLEERDSQGRNALGAAVDMIVSRSGGDVDQKLRSLLEQGADINSRSSGTSPWESAMMSGNAMVILAFLELRGHEVVTTSSRSSARLADALLLDASNYPNSRELVRFGIDNGADISHCLSQMIEARAHESVSLVLDYAAPQQATGVLRAAAERNDLDLLRIALEHQADPNFAIEQAVAGGRGQILLELLRAQADPDLGMRFAMESGRLDSVELLLENGADARKPEYLAFVVVNRSEQLMEFLLRKGADPTAGLLPAVREGNLPFTQRLIQAGGRVASSSLIATAAGTGNEQITNLLLSHGAKPDDGMLTGIGAGHYQLVLLLLDAGARANPSEYISKAGEVGHHEIVTQLVIRGADPSHGIGGAIRNGHTKVVRSLLNAGVAVKPAFLDTAVRNGRLSVTKLLLARGAPPEAGMEAAVHHQNSALIRALIEAGADGSNPEYPVIAVRDSNSGVLAAVIEAGAPLDYADSQGNTLLHLATEKNKLHIVRTLGQGQIDLDRKNKAGDTAAHIAAKKGKDYYETVLALIEIGVNVNAVNAKGKTVLRIAKGNKVEKLLRDNGAKRRKPKP